MVYNIGTSELATKNVILIRDTGLIISTDGFIIGDYFVKTVSVLSAVSEEMTMTVVVVINGGGFLHLPCRKVQVIVKCVTCEAWMLNTSTGRA